MRTLWYTLSGIFVLASLIAYVARPRPAQQPLVFTPPQPQQSPPQPTSSYSRPRNWKPKMSRVATEGKYLYIQHCRTCHGEGGLGNTALAMKVQLRALGSREVQAQSDAEMKQTILLGKGQMRGATRLFSSNEADRLVAYLRTLSSVNEQSAPAQLSLQQQGTTPPPPIAGKSKPPKTLLVGNWANQNPNTPSITRLYIHYVPTGGTEVHAWGRCGGGECDWGEAPASPAPAALSVLWDQHFAVRRWLLSFDGQTRLLTLSEHTHYQDNSGRPDKDETSVFVRTGY